MYIIEKSAYPTCCYNEKVKLSYRTFRCPLTIDYQIAPHTVVEFCCTHIFFLFFVIVTNGLGNFCFIYIFLRQ